MTPRARTKPKNAFVVRVHTDQGIVGSGAADTSPDVARTIVEMRSSHSTAPRLGLGVDPNEQVVERMRVS